MLLLDWPTEDIAIVCMHGLPRPHHITQGWVPKVWCIGGVHQVVWKALINTKHDVMLANVAENVLDTNAKLLSTAPPANDRTLVLCAGGPSLGGITSIQYIRGWRDAGATVWAMNGTYDFLQEHGIIADGLVLMDARVQNIQFLDSLHGKTTYYLATVCNPVLFKKLARYNVVSWHPYIDGIGEQQVLIGGGSTVGLRAICLGWAMGYRKFQLVGYDSSYRITDGAQEGHAYQQDMNKGELELTITFNNREFRCARWMAMQCEQLRDVVASLVMDYKCEVTVIGDGLFPYVISQDVNQSSIVAENSSKEGL
jgi:hypothetical protein